MIPKNKRKSEPDLCLILDQESDLIKSEINCVSLGTIQTFYPDSQTADISLNYKRVSLYGTTPPVDYQLLVKCPVVVLNGGGGCLTFPIASGDSCLVLFCDREIDTWFTNSGVNAPQSARVHDLNDGIALVGIRNALNPISDYSTLAAILSSTQIKLTGSNILDLEGTSNAVLRGSELSLGAPLDTVPEGSTSEIRRIWVVVSTSGNQITLEERRIGLSIPPSPQQRTITVR